MPGQPPSRIAGRVDLHWQTLHGPTVTCLATHDLAEHFAHQVDTRDGAAAPPGGRQWRYRPCRHLRAARPDAAAEAVTAGGL